MFLGLSTSQSRLGLCPTQTWPERLKWGENITHNRPMWSFRLAGLGLVRFGCISVSFRFATGVEIRSNFDQNLAKSRQSWPDLSISGWYLAIFVEIWSRSLYISKVLSLGLPVFRGNLQFVTGREKVSSRSGSSSS